MKILSGGIKQHVQQLGIVTTAGVNADPEFKHPISEFNPAQPGCIVIPQFSGAANANANFSGLTPLQIFDLNHYIFNARDNQTNWPVAPTSQNADVNARAWVWQNINKFSPVRDVPTAVTTINDPRYYIADPLGSESSVAGYNKRTVYRGSIEARFTAYGCTKMPMDYEFAVIKIKDPMMCPDYVQSIAGDDLQKFRNRWQRMIRHWTCNPLINNVEPGPRDRVPWYKVVARKRIRIAEQTTATDTIPTMSGSIKLILNELNNHVWADSGITVDTGGASYDKVPTVNGDINSIAAWNTKPYYTSRYYLMVRARAVVDNYGTGNDTEVTGAAEAMDSQFIKTNRATAFAYTPSYDLVIRNTYYNTIE